MKHISVMLQLVTMIALVGKSAVGGAGLTLALLGAFNLFFEVVDHWMIGGRYLPIFVTAGGVLGGTVGLLSKKS